jgi:glucose-6-phosphate isomerase
MFPKINPTTTKAWSQLQAHASLMKQSNIKNLFKEVEGNRFGNFSLCSEDIVFDYSKNLITKETLQLLEHLATECDLSKAIKAMFSGEKINETEDRAVLHTALRGFNKNSFLVDGKNISADIDEVLVKMQSFCQKIHSGEWLGFTGKQIKYIVNIGIGGSDLGPVMVAEALKPYWVEGVETFFVSNVDAAHIVEVFKKINAEETLFVIASKTFTTQETMCNAFTARDWFLTKANNKDVAKHFVALSTNQKEVVKFGIDAENMFVFWDWVGGRYSLWGAIGLSVALTIGFNNFTNLLLGAKKIDDHFLTTKFDQNIPVLMALIGIWNVNFLGATSEAILPYSQHLHRFAAYLQQCNMESNGKTIDRNGERVTYETGPIIWGEPGTNGQHAFYQLIHQGTRLIPCDFIGVVNPSHNFQDHHEKLMSNFFAQTQALMNGKSEEELKEEKVNETILPYKIFEGNKPTNSFLLKQLSPFALGQLIAMYEHKIFVQGVIWNIFSFDQWGVELGKVLANNLLSKIKSNNDEGVPLDSSTSGLINCYKEMRN